MTVSLTNTAGKADVRLARKGDTFHLLDKPWTVVGFVPSGPAPVVAQMFLKGRGKYLRRAGLRAEGRLDAFEINKTDLTDLPPDTVVYPTFRGVVQPEDQPPAILTPPETMYVAWDARNAHKKDVSQYWDMHWIPIGVYTEKELAERAIGRTMGVDLPIKWDRVGSGAWWVRMYGANPARKTRAYRITSEKVNQWT